MAENKKKPSKHSCDVLIIGGGSAGLRAAIEAHDAGAHVLIISKSRKGDPHTVLARGGIMENVIALNTIDISLPSRSNLFIEYLLLQIYHQCQLYFLPNPSINSNNLS